MIAFKKSSGTVKFLLLVLLEPIIDTLDIWLDKTQWSVMHGVIYIDFKIGMPCIPYIVSDCKNIVWYAPHTKVSAYYNSFRV